MATKTAQIIIEVDDKSLQELNQEIAELEQSIQGLVVGTKEWVKQNQQLGKLKQQFSNAAVEAEKLQNVVQKVGSAEQIRAVAKLGSGLVGGFAAASSAAKLFGANSEVFEEMTAKATSLMAVMGGLNAAADLFSKETIVGLKNVGKSMGGLVRSVKTASLGMKTALLATGIGALVVGVGLLIANFDKLASLVNRSNAKEKKANETNLKLAEDTQKIIIENSKQRRTELEIQDKINSSKSDEYRLAHKSYELAKLAIDDLYAELDVLKAQQVIAQKEADDLANKTTKKGKERKAEKEALLATLQAKQATLMVDLLLLQATARQANAQKQNIGWLDQVNDEIERLTNNITILNAQQDNSQEIYEAQVALLDQQVLQIQAMIDEYGNISKGDEKRIKALETQKIALGKQNDLRKIQLTTDLALLEGEIRRNKIVDDYNQKVYESNQFIQEQFNIERDRQELLESNLGLIELDLEGIKAGRDLRDSMVNFDRKRNEILNERLTTLYPSELKITNEIYESIKRYLAKYGEFNELESFDFFKAKVEELTEGFKSNLLSQFALNIEYEKQTKHGKQLVDDAAQDLAIKKITADFQVKAFSAQIDAVKLQRAEAEKLTGVYGDITSDLQVQKDLVDERLKAERDKLPGKNTEERYRINQAINALENDSAGLQQEINAAQEDVNSSLTQQAVLTNQIRDLEYQRGEAVASVGAAETVVRQELEDQLRLSAQLQDFAGKYAEEIAISTQILGQSMTLISTLFGEKAKKAQREIDKMQKQFDELQEDEDNAHDTRLSYEEELKDANGERYDELLQLIQDEEDKEQEAKDLKDIIDTDIKKKEKERQEAARKQALWEKANAIVQAVIATALGVIKALPNVFLAVATGVLGAAGIVTIAAQKVPPVEEFEEGGHTMSSSSDKTVAGVVHANEYVVPAHIVRSDEGSSLVQALEGMRGYADGGYVAPDISGTGQDMIDYDRLISGIAAANRLLPRPEVSVVKITEQQNDVVLTKEGAGLNR